MGRVKLEISISLDGYVAGPSPTLEQPLGEGGEQLHEWTIRLAGWREAHGLTGGESGPEDDRARARIEATGAVVMGRRMFSGGEGPWQDDPNMDGWWGDEPPFHVPVFILTHHPREPVVKQGGTTFTFVTDGIESALEHARDAAGAKDILVAGGAMAAQESLQAGLLDSIQLHVAPVFLGGGVRLFDGIPSGGLELVKAYESLGVAHLEYRVAADRQTGGTS